MFTVRLTAAAAFAAFAFVVSGCGTTPTETTGKPSEKKAVTSKPTADISVEVSKNRRVARVTLNDRYSDELSAQDIADAMDQLRCYDFTVQSLPVTRQGSLASVIVHCQRAAKGAGSPG